MFSQSHNEGGFSFHSITNKEFTKQLQNLLQIVQKQLVTRCCNIVSPHKNTRARARTQKDNRKRKQDKYTKTSNNSSPANTVKEQEQQILNTGTKHHVESLCSLCVWMSSRSKASQICSAQPNHKAQMMETRV